MNARFAALALLAAAGCGVASNAYERALDRAASEQARAAPERAAAAYLDAARVAETSRDRDEALHRAAEAYRRARRYDDARRLLDDLAARDGQRRARASFDRARLERERGGSSAEVERLLLVALRAHPSSGLAARGLREYLHTVELRAGLEGAIARSTSLLTELAATELDEPARYEHARLLERSGDFASARRAYLECAERHPYPEGALWDDALFAAARCAERLGDARGARTTLERLLAEREEARGLGSYERARYAEARFHLGELHRDAFGDPTRARREFRRVFDEHPTSLLRDDALFQEALVAQAQGDRAGTCAALELLARALPESRFTRCAAELCPELGGKQDRPCPGYLLEAIGSEARSDADQD